MGRVSFGKTCRYGAAALFLFTAVLVCTNCNLQLTDNEFTVEDIEIAETLLNDGWKKYQTDLEKTGDPATACEQLAQWFRAQNGIEDAGVAEDEATVWVHFAPGMTSCVLTERKLPDEGNRNAVPSLYSPSHNNRTFLAFSKAPPSVVTQTSAAVEVENRHTVRGITGMTARLFTPFNYEFKDTDEIMTLQNYYTYPDLADFGVEDILTYKDDKAGIEEVMSALAFNAPAMHFIMNTHGGLTKLHTTKEEANYILCGEYLIPSSAYNAYKEDIQNARIVMVKSGEGVFLGFTPEFVKHYADFTGSVAEEDQDWLVHYVHINACFSYHESMVNAFLDKSGVCYTGFTHKVDCSYGKQVGLQFFDYLADCHTVKEAFERSEPKIDPTNSKCEFKAKGNLEERRYFYRSHVSKGGAASASSATAQWTSMTTDSEGTYFEQNMYDADGNRTGILTVMIDSPQVGTHTIIDGSATKIAYDHIETNILWVARSEEYSEGCRGYVEITKFEDENGGTIEGLFKATTAVEANEPDNPQTTALEGTFIAVRSTTN